jgi:hypothetical protein
MSKCRVFTLLVRESPRCVVPPYALPCVHKNSAPRHFVTRCPHESQLLGTSWLMNPLYHLYSTCTPLWPTLLSSCRDIAILQPRDPRSQTLEPFLARSRDTIPHSDPTVLLCSGSNGFPYLATSRPRDLEYPNVGLSTCKLPSSQDHRSLTPVLFIWMAHRLS